MDAAWLMWSGLFSILGLAIFTYGRRQRVAAPTLIWRSAMASSRARLSVSRASQIANGARPWAKPWRALNSAPSQGGSAPNCARAAYCPPGN